MFDLVTCSAPLGMIRRCSPVLTKHGTGVVITPMGPRALVYVDSLPEPISPLVSSLEMDLSDETGEQHAVSWCAEQVGLPRRGARLEAGDVAGDWLLRVGSRLFWFQAAPVDDGLSGISRHVPGLAGIPNTDEGRRRAVAVIVDHLVANPQEQS